MPYLFQTPTYKQRGTGSWGGRTSIAVGKTLIKVGTSYTLRDYAEVEDYDTATFVYNGGRQYVVDDAEAARLRAAGYGYGLTLIGFGVPYPSEFLYPNSNLFPSGGVEEAPDGSLLSFYPSPSLYPLVTLYPREP